MRSFVLAVALMVGLLVYSPRAHAQDVDTRVAALVEEGMRLGDAGNLPGARAKLLEAWGLKKTFDIAANLGFVETNLKEWAAAAEHLDYAQRTFPVSGTDENKQNIEKFLADARSKVGRIQVKAEPGTAIYEGTTLLATAPFDGPLYLMPGTHSLTAKKAGKLPGTQAVEAQAGADAAVEFSLADDATTNPPPGEKALWPAILLGVTGGVGVALGIGLTVGGEMKAADAEDIATTCQPFTQTCHDTAQEELDTADLLTNVGIVGFAVGGAALLGMVVYLAIPGDAPAQTALRIVPVLTGTTQGLFVSTSF